MRSTALQAVALAVLSQPAAAQLAATTRPSGGQVTAGQATIGGNANTTLIQQTSQNAAIDWKTYNVGSGQTVQYAQPDASAITLNTVIAANPSQIAGKILANGRIIIVNQSGVVFTKGSQVDTAGLVVSSAGISNKDFMAGRLVFNQPGHPGASISNAGNITIRQAGLAALVAPQVANSGMITAKFGRVILAGATTHTLDLYGDGLVALNITGQVTQISLNGKVVPALVTNTGTILAPGGTIVLTAAAADSLVTNLVSAGGTLAAPSQGAQTGRVLVQGIGGGVSIDGQVSATGTDAGTTGGQVVVNATGRVNVLSGALIDASGVAGGGVIAVGTTAARALGGASVHPKLTARTVNLAAGSRIRANATGAGQGGRIAVLSTEKTSQLGNITATGGATAGNGGWIEVSGKDLSLGGIIDDGAAHGKLGSILFDPANIVIGSVTGTGSHASTLVIAPSSLGSYTGNVILDAAGTIEVNQPVDLNPKLVKTFQLEGDEGIAIDSTIHAPGIAVALKSANGAITENASGSITASSISATSSGAISLTGQNVSTLIAPFSSAGTTASGVVAVLDSDGFAISRPATAANEIPALAGLVSGGDVTVAVAGTTDNNTPNTLAVTGNIIGTDVALSVTGTASGDKGNAFTQISGTISALGLETGTNLGHVFTPGTVQITAASGGISLAGRVLTSTPGTTAGPSGSTTLTAQAGDINEARTGSIDTGTLTGAASGSGNSSKLPTGNANFAISAGNTVSTLTGFTTSGSFALEDDTGLLLGTVTAAAGSIAISGPSGSGAKPTGSLTIAGAVTAAGSITLSNALGISELTGAAVRSTASGIALSTAGSITQAGTSTLTGEEASASGTAVSLSAGTGISLGGTVTAGAIPRGATAYSGIAAMFAARGNIAELIGGSIRAGTLTGAALSTAATLSAGEGNADFAVSSGNTIKAVNAFTTTNGFALEDDTGLIVGSAAGGSLAAGGSIGITGPTATDTVLPTGILIINQPIKGSAGVSLSNALGIAELSAGSVASPGGAVTLTTSGGAIYQQAGGTLSGAVSSSAGTALVLTAGGTTDFNTYFAAAGIGTVSGLSAVSGLSLSGGLVAGTLSGAAYTGLAVLTASDGDIAQGAGGSIRAGTLSGSATGSGDQAKSPAGNAIFDLSASNTVATVTDFTTTGNFLLEASGLTIGALTSGGSISIFGSAGAAGILVIDGAVSAVNAIGLSNALGIAELAGGSVTSTLSSVTLSSGGAIAQKPGASLAGLESASTGTGLVVSAGGTTNFATYLPAAGIGSVSGLSFAGTLQAGGLAGGIYQGAANLVASAGDILEAASGSLRAGTLSGSAAGSGNALFDSTSGNMVGALASFSTTGNFALEDDAGLTIGNLAGGGSIDIFGPPTGVPSGTMVITGAITAPGNIALSNAAGITEDGRASVTSAGAGVTLTAASGAITQLAGATITGEEASAAGTAIALSAGTGISFAGTLSADVVPSNFGDFYSGIASMQVSSGNIAETAGGSVRAAILTGDALSSSGSVTAAAGNARFAVSAGNTIATLTGFTTSGALALEDDTGLTLGNLVAGGSIAVNGPASGTPSGILVISGAVKGGTSVSLGNVLGIAELASGSVTSTAGGVALSSERGAIYQQAGGTLVGALASSAGTALALTAGGTTDFNTYLPAAAFGTVGGVSLNGGLTAGGLSGGAYTGLAVLTAAAGDIAEAAGASIHAGTLSGRASGNALFQSASGNSIGTLTGFSATGNIAVVDTSGLTLGSVTGGGTLDVAGPTGANPTGILVIDGNVSAPGAITLGNALGIAERAAGTITSTRGGVTLATAGAIDQQKGGSISSGEASSTGTALSLTAGGTTYFTTYLPQDGIGSVSGIAFGGSLIAGISAGGIYGGSANFTVADGSILESASGSLRAGTLTGSASGAGLGTAQFIAGPTNAVATLPLFTTSGGFVLADDAQLQIGTLTAGGSIDVSGPTGLSPTGILSVSGTVRGGGDVTLSNALGVAVLPKSAVISTAGGVTLASSGGALALPAGSILSGGVASSAGTAISLTSGGTTDFDTYLPTASLGTVTGISFGGTITAGTAIGGGFTGIADVTTLAGNFAESAGATLQAGTLTGSIGGSGNPMNAPEGNAQLDTSAGNTIGVISQFTAYGNVGIEDDAGVSLGNITAGGLITIVGPTGAGALPTGILSVTGTLAAPGDITLSNALGIAELTRASIASSKGDVTLLTGGAFDQQANATISGGQASAGGTALNITASGTTDFGTYLPSSGLGTISGLAFGGTLAAGALIGGAYTGAANLVAASGPILEGTAGSLRAGTLSGSAGGNAAFDTASGNTVGTLASFVTGGNFALEDNGLRVDVLTAVGSIGITGPGGVAPTGILVIAGTMSAGGSISLSNALGIAELANAGITSTQGGVTLASSGGAIAQLAGATLAAGSGASAGSAVSLSAGGSTDFATFLPASGLDTVQGIAFAGTVQSGPLSGTAYAGSASLIASAGTIAEASGAHIFAGTLSGSASGNAGFGIAAGNSLSVLAGFTTGGGFTLEDDTALTVAGPVTAGTNINIYSATQAARAPGILIIAGSLTAATFAAGDGTISLSNGQGILETGTGAVQAANALTLASGGAIVQLPTGIFRVTNADAASGVGTVSLSASGSTDFAPYAPYAAFGTVGGIELSGALTAGATAHAPGGTAILIATAGDITETAPGAASATGSIFAGALTAQAGTLGGTAYAIDLGNGLDATPSNEIGTLFGTDATPFFASGSITIADNGTLFGPSGSPAVTLLGAVTAQTGSLTVGITGADLDISQPGALPISAGTAALLRTTAGTLANGTVFTGTITQSSGTIEAPTIQIEAGQAFDQSAGATLIGTGVGGSIGITAGSSIALGGTLTANGVSLAALQGDIAEVALRAPAATGVIEAGVLSASAQAGIVALDTESSAGAGNQIAQLGASSAAGGFTLVDGEGLTVTGAVQAGLTAPTPSVLTIVAPAIDVTTGSLAIAPPNGTAPGILSLVADQFTFGTAGDVQTPGGIVALDLLNANGSSVFSVGTAGTNTVAPSSLQNISAGAGTLAIGSLDGTLVSPQTAVSGGWGIGSGGTVTAIDIGAGFDLQTGGSAKALGLFSNGSIAASGGITVSALYGIAADGTALLTGANAISTLGVQTGSGLFGFTAQQAGAPANAVAFQLVDDAPLTVLGPVLAPQGAVNISVIGANGSAPGLTLGSAVAGSGRISGTDIDLSATGGISQVAGTLNAFGAPHGTITLNATAGGISLGGTVATGTFGSSIFALDPAGAILLAADGGTVTESAATVLATGTLAAAASGDILLAAGTNTVDVIAPLTVGSLSLSGLTASGTNGITFTDTGALLVADGAVLSAYGPAGTTGPGIGSITLSLTTGALSLGSAAGATIAAPGDITLTAPGGIAQSGGLIASGANVTLAAGTASAAAGISQAGGTIAAAGNVSETATGPAGGSADILLTTLTLGLGTTGSVIDAGQDVTLVSATGSFVLTGSSITGSNAVTLDFLRSIDLSAGSTLASPGPGPATPGTLVVASATGSIVANGALVADGIPGDVLLSAGAGDIVQSATGSIIAGTLAASAPGNISLLGRNQVSTIGSLGAALNLALPQTLTLYGLTAGGSAGIVFDDLASLQIGPDTGAHAVIEESAPAAPLTINELGSGQSGFGSLVIGGAGASSLMAGGNITLTSLGSIFQDAGTIRSLNAAVGLVSANGSVIQAGSTIDAATGISISAGQDFDQTSGVIESGGGFALLAGGAVQQSGGSTMAAVASISITTGVNASLNGQSSSFGDFTQIGSVIRAGTDLTIDSVSGAPFSGTLSQSSGSTLAGQVVSLSSAEGDFAQSSSVMEGTAGATLSIYGDITSTNGLIESAGAANAPGLVSITSATGSVSSTGTGALIEAGLPNGILTLSAFGNIVADQVIAGTLSGSAGGGIQMSGTNTIAAVTSLVAATGPIDLTDQIGLTLLAGGTILSDQGNVAISGQTLAESTNALIRAAQTVSIASAGGMTLDGTVQGGTSSNGMFGGAVALSAGSGGIEAAGGVLLAGTLAASSGGVMDLSDATNQIAQIGAVGALGGLAASGPITLADGQSLVVAAPVTGAGNVSFTVAPGSFSENAGTGITASGALAINAGGAVTIGGALNSGPLTLISGGSFAELAGAGITATGAGAITAGQAVTIDGRIAISGATDIAAATNVFEGTDGTISIPAPATLMAPGSVTLDGLVSVPGALTIIAGTAFSEGPGALITAGSTSIDAQTGAVMIGGTLTASGQLTLTAGTDITEGQAGTSALGSITAGITSITATHGAVTINGVLQTAAPLTITAGTDFNEAATASMTLNPNAVPSTPGVSHYMPPPELQRVSISAGGGITIDGLISYPGPLQFAAGNVFTEGATGSIFNRSVFGGTSVSAQSGDAIIDGIMAAEGGLTMTAGADIIVQGSVASLGSTLAAGGSVSIPGTLTSSFGQTTIQAGSFIDVGGVLGAGATQLTSGANVSIGGALTAQGALGIDADGGISIPGTVGDTGSTFVAGGAVSIGGILTSGATTLRGDGIDIGGAILAAATQLTSAAGVTIEGSVSARGTLGISAADGIDEHLGGSISAGAISLIAKTANDVIDGALTASGALNLTAGADISQGAASAIDAATTADLLAPGTITLAGLLAAPGILIGERATRDVVWDGNTLRADTSLHGPTKAINVLAPLAPGAGVFVQSAAFQQIGNAFVDPLTGTSATLQITIEGKGTAHFDQLTAPQAQLLLVLDNAGFAGGLIDVAGLNAYYTQGETPVQAANLFGVVGGHHGTAAAGVGFSHLNSNINYQINGCPIQSIDCVLISPVVVPVVDPVTDYAEGTQHRRHQDDDALPNVGEEDY